MIAFLALLTAAASVTAPMPVGDVQGWTVWRFAPKSCAAVKGPAGAAFRPLGIGDHFQGPTPFVQISARHGSGRPGDFGIGIEARYVGALVRARRPGEAGYQAVRPVWPRALTGGEVELYAAGYLYPAIRYGYVEESARVDMTGADAALAATRDCALR